MATTPTTKSRSGRTGRPPVTSRAQILAAARRLIDRDGWEKLTIRRLAAELGIGPTTLYHHIRDKEDLLILLLSHYIEQIDKPELPSDPRDRIVEVGVSFHDAFRAWPWAAEVLTTDGFIARLDEPALWSVEVILAGARECGCTQEQSILVFRNIWYYTVGEILVRARTDREWAGKEKPPLTRSLDPNEMPHLTAVAPQWAEVAQRDTFREGLSALVDGLLAQATRR
ncbi:TetR/AcrR family transcriptional regulator C-terminal domain-containing protein [Actinomadura barringtoniae]|uniref:TetR/AcrR family transcriptional regulator C-terminal domain-containing protein n=1 Tax=Actinomadura barringtoniae TaxID=1427535 RepID=A0A939PI40_9ACTN|nr:TetR/AcrR family transcriptional regulator [Actinomadura barringtoniae]MBO2452687.1 TetR/AcrR family transcriptional regulator C-terminal domain-containing protein [Actinomadura barringtoniae]